MSGFFLSLLAIIFLIRGCLRIYKPTRGSLYKAWKVKFDSEPSDEYIKSIKFSGISYITLGSILLACGLFIIFL